MITITELLARLHGVHKTDNGWEARCPAHDDRQASLSISEGDKGIVLHCHAGCTTAAICAKVEITVDQLFYESRKRGTLPLPRKHPPPPPPRAKQRALVGTSHDALIARMEQDAGRPIAAHWRYELDDGTHIGTILRWNNDDGTKNIKQISRNGDDNWHAKTMPDPKPLYHLPLLLANPTHRVYVTEGEKAADAGTPLQLLTTTSSGGSKAAGKTDWSPLAGRDVVILPDNDKSGKEYAEQVAGILAALEPPAIIRIVNLPDLEAKGDLADYVAIHDNWTTEQLAESIEAIVAVTAPCGGSAAGQPVMVCMADVVPKQVSWLWPGRIPMGRITLLVGRPGEGKSFLTTDISARVTTGSPWPDDSGLAPRGEVIMVAGEDDPSDTIRPRLDANGADNYAVHLLTAVNYLHEKTKRISQCIFSLADIDPLEFALRQHPNCKLLIIDPIGSFLGGSTDAHRDNEVRSVLAPLAKLGEKYGAAVLIVAHRRKSTGGLADDLVLGSRAFTGIARSVIHISADPKNCYRRLMLPGKNNLARRGDGMAFGIAGEAELARIYWEKDPVRMTADEGLAAEASQKGPEPDARNSAARWLRTLLADGPVDVTRIKADAEAAGMNYRTIQRAADSLKIESGRTGFNGTWQWSLPSGQHQLDK